MNFNKITLEHTTNPKFKHLEGEVGSLEATEGKSAIFDYELLYKYLITSTVQEIESTETSVKLRTKNSTYTFTKEN